MQNEIVKITKKLIEFKTVEDNKDEILRCFDYIEKYFSNEIESGKIIKKDYTKDGVSSVVFSNSNTLNFDIILSGHIDVVRAEDKDFVPSVKEGRLYGRGVADMKSEVATMMTIFKNVSNIKTNKSIALMITSDEEMGGKRGTNFLVNEIGYRSKVVILPDGGFNFKLVTEAKGGMWIKLTSFGKSAHASRPWQGENAISKLIDSHGEFMKSIPFEKMASPLFKEGISINLGKMSGGKSLNSVPSEAEMYYDIRYSTQADREMIVSKISELTKKNTIRFEILEDVNIFKVDLDNYYIKKFRQVFQKNIKQSISLEKEIGGSDARIFSEKDIPVIMLMPNCGNTHKDNEWVEIESLKKFHTVIEQFISEIINK